MIIKMKSIAVLGLESRTETILEELRDIGALHVHHVKPPEGRSLEEVVRRNRQGHHGFESFTRDGGRVIRNGPTGSRAVSSSRRSSRWAKRRELSRTN